MTVAIVTGSGGLVGSAAARSFAAQGMDVVGIDNDMRSIFIGSDASTRHVSQQLIDDLGARYTHHNIDIRDNDAMTGIIARYGTDIGVIVHAAAQPGHSRWAMIDPLDEFDINARATLSLLELTLREAPQAVFIFCSTTKVYGDRPNTLPYVEHPTRWDLDPSHEFYNGITEDFGIDQSVHTSMGMSKLAADVMVQEYGRHHGLNTVIFRSCNIAGPAQAASRSHGMLGYVLACVTAGRPFTAYGYGGKQVRDVLHVDDLIAGFNQVIASPRPGAVYNMGGGRFANCSVLEAIDLAQHITGNTIEVTQQYGNPIGDHIWWIGSNERFRQHYPQWQPRYDVETMMRDIHAAHTN